MSKVEWLSIADLADELGISTQTVYNWRHRGIGPRGFKRGNLVRYRRSDVDAWLNEGRDPRPNLGRSA